MLQILSSNFSNKPLKADKMIFWHFKQQVTNCQLAPEAPETLHLNWDKWLLKSTDYLQKHSPSRLKPLPSIDLLCVRWLDRVGWECWWASQRSSPLWCCSRGRTSWWSPIQLQGWSSWSWQSFQLRSKRRWEISHPLSSAARSQTAQNCSTLCSRVQSRQDWNYFGSLFQRSCSN